MTRASILSALRLLPNTKNKTNRRNLPFRKKERIRADSLSFFALAIANLRVFVYNIS